MIAAEVGALILLGHLSERERATGSQLETLAKDQRRPSPDAWSVLGARDRLLTPWTPQLALAEPIEARSMFGGGDSLPAMRIRGLSTATFSPPDASLIFVFMPMSSFFTLPDTAYTLTDLTSKVFVPITEDQVMDLVEEHGTQEESAQVSEKKRGKAAALTERQKLLEEREERNSVQEQAVIEEKEQLTERRAAQAEVEQRHTALQEQQEERQEVLEGKEQRATVREEAVSTREESVTTREETVNAREEGLDGKEEEQKAREEQQGTREEQQNQREQALEQKAGEQDAREEQQTEKETKLTADAAVLQEKEDRLSEQQTQQEQTEKRLQEDDQQLQDRETKLGEDLKASEEKREKLDEREQTLNDKEQQLEQKATELTEKENLLNQEQTALEEKQEETRQHEEELEQREQTLKQETELVREREVKVEEEEKRLEEKGQQMQEREETLKQQEKQMEDLQTKLTEEEERLNNRETSLNDMETALNERNEKLNEQENTLTEKEKALEEENERQVQKSEELQQKEEALSEKERSLNEMEQSLNQMKTKLEEDEEKLNERERGIEEQEQKLQECEARNRETEDRQKVRGQELDECEERHRQWEIRSREEQEMMAERKKGLQELEAMLKDWEKRSQEEEGKLKEEEQRVKAEEESLRERERGVEEEEDKQKEWRERLEKEDGRQKDMSGRLEGEEERHQKRREKLQEEEDRQTETECGDEREGKGKRDSPSGKPRKDRKRRMKQKEEEDEGDVDGWQVWAVNARFKVRCVKEEATYVDKGVNTDRPKPQGPERPYYRRTRSMSPQARAGFPGSHDPSSLASVLTEDDVIMVSSFKGTKATIIETYDIKYLREEIFEDARESRSTHGITRPGKGLRKSHESESFELSAEETGRGSASPCSSSTSRSESSSRSSSPTAKSHVSVEIQNDGTSSAAEVQASPSLEGAASVQGKSLLKKNTSPTRTGLENEPAARKSVSFGESEPDRSHSRSPSPILDRQKCTSPAVAFSTESEGTDTAVPPSPRMGWLPAGQQEHYAPARKPSPADKLSPFVEKSASPKCLVSSLTSSPTIRFVKLSEHQDHKEKEETHERETKAASEKTAVSTEQTGRSERKQTKKDDGCSLERTDFTSTSEESYESCEPSPDISIDCVSPEMAMMFPNWLTANQNHDPNDIIIDVQREPVRQLSPSRVTRNDAPPHQRKTVVRGPPFVSALGEGRVARGDLCGREQAADTRKESPLRDTRPQLPSAPPSAVRDDSPKTSEKTPDNRQSPQTASPSPRRSHISPRAHQTVESHLDQWSVSKANDNRELKQLNDGQLSQSVWLLSSPPSRASPDSSPSQRGSLPGKAPQPCTPPLSSKTSASPSSPRLSPLPCQTRSKASSPSSDRPYQSRPTPPHLSPLESASVEKRSSKHSVSSDSSPIKAEAAQSPRETSSPVPERKSQTMTLVVERETPSGLKSSSRSPTRSPAKSSSKSSRATAEPVSPCRAESLTLSQLKSPPSLSPESSPGERQFPSSLPINHNLPLFLTALVQTLETMQVQTTRNLVASLSPMSSPTKSANASSIESPRLSRASSPSKSISPSADAFSFRSVSPEQDRRKCVDLEQCAEREPTSPSATTLKAELSSAKVLSPSTGFLSGRQAQPDRSSSERWQTPSPVPPGDKDQEDSRTLSPVSGQSALSRSPSLKSPSVVLSRAQSEKSWPVTSSKSSRLSTTPARQTSPFLADLLTSSSPESVSPEAVKMQASHPSSPSLTASQHSTSLTSKSPDVPSPKIARQTSSLGVSGSLQATPDSKLSGSQQLSPASKLSGLSQSQPESRISGSPQSKPESRISGSPQATPDRLSGSPQATPDRLSGSPQVSPASKISGSPQVSPASKVSASLQATPESKISRSPLVSPTSKLSTSPQATPESKRSGSPQVPPKQKLSASPQAQRLSNFSGSVQSLLESIISGSPQATPESKVSGSPQLSPDSREKVTSEPRPVSPPNIDPAKSPAWSSLSKLPVPLPHRPLQSFVQAQPQDKHKKPSEVMLDSPSLVDQETRMPSDEHKAGADEPEVASSENSEFSLLDYPVSMVNSAKSKLQTLVAHFEKYASEASYQLAPGSTWVPPKENREHHDELESPQEDQTPSQSPALSPSAQPMNSRESLPTLSDKRSPDSRTSSFILDAGTDSEISSPRKRPADGVSEESPTPPDHWLKHEGQALSAESVGKRSLKSAPATHSVSPSSWVSQSSSNRGRSPGPKRRSAGHFSPVMDHSLAGLLAAQRRKLDSPRSLERSDTQPSNVATSPPSQPAPRPPLSELNAVLQPDSTKQPVSEVLAPLAVPASLPATAGHASPVSNVSSAASSTQNPEQGSRIVSPSRSLISTALKTNGAANLRTMLARQRRASQDRDKGTPQAARIGQRLVRSREEFLSAQKAKSEKLKFPQEHKTTSVHQTVIDREGKPPSSIVTITQKKVTYSREPVPGDVGAAVARSPPKMSSVPVPNCRSVQYPKPVFSGSTGFDRRTQVSGTAAQHPASLPGSDISRRQPEVSSDLGTRKPSTALRRNSLSPHSAENPTGAERPLSDIPKANPTSQSPSAPKLGLIRIMMNTDTRPKCEGQTVNKRPFGARTHNPPVRSQGGRGNIVQPSLSPDEQTSSTISTKSSEAVENQAREERLYDASSMRKENQTRIPAFHGSKHVGARAGQMDERETLIRRRTQAKRLYERRNSLRKSLTTTPCESDDSDFSDFFQEYQTECQKRGISPENSPTTQRAQLAPRRGSDKSTVKQGHRDSQKNLITPTPTSPPVKRRALDASEEEDVRDPSRPRHSPHTAPPSNTCNSSPVKRAKRYEMNRFSAYPMNSPTRTNLRSLQLPSTASSSAATSSNRSSFHFPVSTAPDRPSVLIAFGPQLQTYRHQQGVVGDSVEMVDDFARPGRSVEHPVEQQASPETREKRRKQSRRVSWNDNQSSSPADYSHNQNAALNAENAAAEEEHGKAGRSDSGEDQDTSRRQSLDIKLETDPIRPLQIDTVNSVVEKQPPFSQRDEDSREARFAQQGRTHEIQQSTLHSQKPQHTKYAVSKSLTNDSQFNRTFVHDREGTDKLFPTSVQFSREQSQSTEYRPVGYSSSFAKEEATRRKEFTATENSGVTSMAQKQSLRKSYTLQSQRKRASIIHERQQTREYIFKKNPHTARFPEGSRYPGQLQRAEESRFSMNTQNNASTDETERRCGVDGGESSQRCEGGVHDDIPSGTNNNNQGGVHDDDTPGATNNNNNLSLCQELRNAGFPAGERSQSGNVEEGSSEGDSVDMMDYGDVDRWVGMPVDPYLYQCSMSHLWNLNESANSSAAAGYNDTSSSPEEKMFFTPEVVTDDRKVTGNASRVQFTPTPQGEYVSFQTHDQYSHGLLTADYHQHMAGAFHSPSDGLEDHRSSLYFSVPRTQSVSSASSGAGSFYCRPLLRYRRRRYKRRNGNKNNSGDDHPKLSSQSNLPRKEEHCVYDNVLENSACGRGDQGVKVEPKKSEETHPYLDKGQDYRDASESKMTVLRRKRSIGRTYLSRLLAKRNFSQHDSQDLSDNCAHAHSGVPEHREPGCEAQRCQCPYDADNAVIENAPVPYTDCRCQDTQTDFCLCLGNGGATCQDTSYDEDDPDDDEEEEEEEEEEDVDDVCQEERCQECGCSMDFRTALTLEDQRLVPRAMSQLWQSPGQCEDPDCTLMSLHTNTDPQFQSCRTGEEEEERGTTRSLPLAYTEDYKCAHSYCPGRGEGDVLPAIRKEEQNYNVSRCQREEAGSPADFVFRQENADEGKDHKRKGRLKSKLNEERCVEEEKTDTKHPHNHARHHSANEYLTQAKPSPTHSQSSEANEAAGTSSLKDAHHQSVTESMVQAYGYNPLTQSPFSARGYPGLAMNTSSLDHITLPFVKRKALVFLRTDKEEFVEVGRGTYGCVYLAQATTKRGTAKVVVKDFFTDSSSWDLIVHEARMLCYLQDTGVIPHFYGLLKRRSHGDDFSLIQQYFAQGRTLHTVLVNKEQLSPEVWQDVAWQLARGLLLIHERHVLLNDLKGDNVLIDLRRERKIIKYIDLGMATYRKGLNFHLPEDQMSKFNFLSPEVRAGAYTSPMSDVYSLGYLLDQINRLAHLHLLKEVSSRCMDDLPVDRLHLADVVHVLTPDPDFLSAAASAAAVGGAGASHRH